MTHPFVALGAISVTVITATFGILQVPGWVERAENDTASSVLAHVQAYENAAVTKTRAYWGGDVLQEKADMQHDRFSADGTVIVCATASPAGDGYALIARSKNGTFLARTSSSTDEGKGETAEAALAEAGGLPPGVPSPTSGSTCAPGAALALTS